MAKALRVKLDPLSSGSPVGAGARKVLGARVRFASFGNGKTQAKRDAPVPNALTFQTRFFERIRDDAGTELETIATLRGSLTLSKTTGQPKFDLDPEAETPLLLEPETPLENAEGASSSSPPRRTVRLEF